MLNKLIKKGKSNKGFTLVELIVVIAIIGILALILVPRFAGFTDTAKEGADTSAASTLQTSLMAMVASNDLIVTNNPFKFTINNSGTFAIVGAGTATDAGGTAYDAASLKTAVELLTGEVRSQSTGTTGFEVTINLSPAAGDDMVEVETTS